MRLYFDYYGNFPKYTNEDLAFGSIEFDTNGKHYIVDVSGEVDYELTETHISGRIKGDYKQLVGLDEELLADKELVDAILDMDTSTFKFNLIEDEDGCETEPEFEKCEIEIHIGELGINFTRSIK